jgi:hypothetical protein
MEAAARSGTLSPEPMRRHVRTWPEADAGARAIAPPDGAAARAALPAVRRDTIRNAVGRNTSACSRQRLFKISDQIVGILDSDR